MDLDKIWFLSRSCSCELIIVIVFGIGSHGVGWCLLLLCNGNSSSYYNTPTIFNNLFWFYIGSHFENFKNRAQLWVMIYFCVKFQKDPLFGVNLTLFAPWLPLQRPPFWICTTPQKQKKMKNTKMIIAGYSPNRNWWNLIGTTSKSSGTR
jgi:hypothetical protein